MTKKPRKNGIRESIHPLFRVNRPMQIIQWRPTPRTLLAHPSLPCTAALRTLMVADHLVDDEAQEFFGEIGVEIGVCRQPA